MLTWVSMLTCVSMLTWVMHAHVGKCVAWEHKVDELWLAP